MNSLLSIPRFLMFCVLNKTYWHAVRILISDLHN